ncbi:LiaF transmembrane domain-containing protein [Niabella ginsengisoli]|uniref:Cell wall-active antibiotics response protein n=1 Tax=Niabella ginsengisoli TaxID=522298 RepID=A0ABS9SF67_9BACT|nr:LiaF domain-containing protein [Niabella ginsengisoli]MCH5596809.1 cell wall-active antibiotics response protein [Niabella ginsengisoli]
MSENNPYNTEMYKSEPGGYPQPDPKNFRPKQSQSHIWIGGFLLVIGVVYLLKKMGLDLPDFLFSWQMFLIALGIFIGIRKNFEGPGWMILVLIGSIFLINEFFVFGELRRFILPIILIGSGLFFIFRPKGSKNYIQFDEGGTAPLAGASGQDYIDTTSIFGGSKKKVFSKSFKGGDMTNVFGGSEIDLSQADINGTAVLDVTALFGGATLIVPSHWNVISEAVAIMGEVKDKRVMQGVPEVNKTLLIKGTVIFGGIDIKSF